MEDDTNGLSVGLSAGAVWKDTTAGNVLKIV
jgi:hypothetical protein